MRQAVWFSLLATAAILLITVFRQMREKYQGISPPVVRSEADFDPGAKYHVLPTYLTRAISWRGFCSSVLSRHVPPGGIHRPLYRCSFYGNKDAGAKLNAMLEMGQSKPWQTPSTS